MYNEKETDIKAKIEQLVAAAFDVGAGVGATVASSGSTDTMVGIWDGTSETASAGVGVAIIDGTALGASLPSGSPG